MSFFIFCLQLIFWLSCFPLVYSYILYPFLLSFFDRFYKGTTRPHSHEYPDVSIVIAAYNEEKVIKARIDNCLSLDYPTDKMEIIIASDGSSDETNDIVREYAGDGIILFDYKERRGKVNVLNDTVPRAKSDIVIFSDANTLFAKGAIKTLVHHFEDPKVGCVCGGLRFVNAMGSTTADLEGVYWRYETFLKKMEGKRGALLGANGAIFGIRKNLFVTLPSDTIVEDFVLPMKILEGGYKVVYEPEAVAIEEAAKHIIHEKERRIRIGAGDFQALFMLLRMLSPARGFPALAFWSHKVLRWFGPFFLISAFLSNWFLISIPFFAFFFYLQCCFYLAAIIGWILSYANMSFKPFNLCHYFVSMNMALLLGFVRFITRTQHVAWKRTER